MKDIKYKDLAQKNIGAYMKVHSMPGNGFQQMIYPRALEIELKDGGTPSTANLIFPYIIKTKKWSSESRLLS